MGLGWGFLGGNRSLFIGRKTVGPDASVRHVPQGTAGALPATELCSQGMTILPPADT